MSTPFQRLLATTSQNQYNRFHLLRENQPPLNTQIAKYWNDLGLPFQNVSVAWSAVFVSWCVKQAGATAVEFRFAQAHAVFAHWAIQNSVAGTGLFRGHDPARYAPKLGDILQNNRSGHQYDFNHAAANTQYQSHSAIVMEVGTDNVGKYLRTIGGNEADSVGMKEVRLNANGRVKNANGVYISVIETLK
jgi:hypothetical protein